MTIKRLFLGAVLGMAGVAPATSFASDYGCKVLLCLSNPQSNGGPLGVAECTEPILQLYSDLRRGKPFPQCGFEDGNNGQNYARLTNEPYDPCPAGTKAVTPGTLVGEGTRRGNLVQLNANATWVMSESNSEYGTARACVGQLLGTVTIGSSADDARVITVYDKVVLMPFKGFNAIDVFIDNKLTNRVWF